MIDFIRGIFHTMNEKIVNLFYDQQDNDDADDFAMYVENLASKYEVTADYYMMEFM
jgi:hypothetical protein